jgi:hypothetical protein
LAFTFTGRSWRATWEHVSVGVLVAGSDDAPHPVLLATARDVIDRWDDIEREIEAFLHLLVEDDGRVELDPPKGEYFAARDCGFEGRLFFQAISVLDEEAPRSALVTFYTGYPDGYATFELRLEDGIPGPVSAYAS